MKKERLGKRSVFTERSHEGGSLKKMSVRRMKDGSRTRNEDGRDEEKESDWPSWTQKTQHPLTNGFSSPNSTLIANRNLQCRKLVTRDWCGSTSTCTTTRPPSLPPSPTPTHHATTP